jgi:hypothetical protein
MRQTIARTTRGLLVTAGYEGLGCTAPEACFSGQGGSCSAERGRGPELTGGKVPEARMRCGNPRLAPGPAAMAEDRRRPTARSPASHRGQAAEDSIGTPAVPLEALGTMRDGAFNLGFSRDRRLDGAGACRSCPAYPVAADGNGGVTS